MRTAGIAWTADGYEVAVLDGMGQPAEPPARYTAGDGDWARPGAPAIARNILTQAQAGSIVLLHDGGGDRSQTVEALAAIMEGLLERGYEFTTVDALAAGRSRERRSD